MARLILCYNGSGLEGRISELLNTLNENSRLREVAEPIDPDRVRLWFRAIGRDYEPETFAVVLSERGAVIGFSWAWVTAGEEPVPQGFVRLTVDDRMPWSDAVDAALALLSWARHSLEYWQEVRGVVDLMLSGRGSRTNRLVYELLGEAPGKVFTGGYVMIAPEREAEARLPRGYRVRKARPHKNRSDAEALVKVFNDAFSSYDTFWPWRVDRAMEYYGNLFSKRKAIVLLAEDEQGEPAGFIEAYLHPSISGGLAGELSLLAVSKRHQGRGLGTALLLSAEEWLRSKGAGIVYLYAVPKASALYLKLGYKIIDENLRIRVPLEYLPDPRLDGVEPWDNSVCPSI